MPVLLVKLLREKEFLSLTNAYAIVYISSEAHDE